MANRIKKKLNHHLPINGRVCVWGEKRKPTREIEDELVAGAPVTADWSLHPIITGRFKEEEE